MIGFGETPTKAILRNDRKPRKVRERIETARITRLVRLIGGDMGKMAERGEAGDYSELAQITRGTLAAGVERLYNTMQEMPRGIAGHNVTLSVVESANAVLKSAIAALNGPTQNNNTNIQINLPTGAEAEAFFARLEGKKTSRIVDLEAENESE